MISCKRAAELASKKLDQPLGVVERICLALHLFSCRICTRYAEQLAFLRNAGRRFDAVHYGQVKLDEARRANLIERLKKAAE